MTNGHKRYTNFLFQGFPKYIKISVFGMKIYHLTTLRHNSENVRPYVKVTYIPILGSEIIHNKLRVHRPTKGSMFFSKNFDIYFTQ
jgi:hypothetical protein